jgi:hypothetical protein
MRLRLKATVGITSLILPLAFSSAASAATTDGPFPIERTQVTNVKYSFDRKLEIDRMSGELAAESASEDGTITLKTSIVVKKAVIDPVTLMPVLNPDGTALTTDVAYAAGTILNPSLNPDDNILLPKGVTVTNKVTANGPKTIGRFTYYGNAPRFTNDNLEMTASKMGHSLRVKAWVTSDMMIKHEYKLLMRFKGIYDAFMNPKIHVSRLKSFTQMANATSNSDLKKWYQVAAHYSQPLIENSSVNVYDRTKDEVTTKTIILTGILQALMNNKLLTIDQGLLLLSQYTTDPNLINTRAMISSNLFTSQFSDRFARVVIDPAKPARIGYLTFVYPIAIDKKGPFGLPSPGLRQFPLRESMESRIWSSRWLDEFGGFPFMQITSEGVAFHGPITSMSDASDTWYLRRDNVSHSCMRMDPSDLLELRALLPEDMLALQAAGRTIPLVIQEWPDVTDVDNNGTMEVIDVAYYNMPTYLGKVNNPENWKPSAMNKQYWTDMFSPFINKLPSKNTFVVNTTQVVDPITKVVTKTNAGVFTGLPIYTIIRGETVIIGYNAVTPIMTMAQRPTAILQYKEDAVEYKDLDNEMSDNKGIYPQRYFNKLYPSK